MGIDFTKWDDPECKPKKPGLPKATPPEQYDPSMFIEMDDDDFFADANKRMGKKPE